MGAKPWQSVPPGAIGFSHGQMESHPSLLWLDPTETNQGLKPSTHADQLGDSEWSARSRRISKESMSPRLHTGEFKTA